MGNTVLALLLFLQGGDAAALPDAPETVEGSKSRVRGAG